MAKGKLSGRLFWENQGRGGGNFCRKVVILFRKDPISGCKEIVKIFQSMSAAMMYRRRTFGKEYMGKLNELFPAEVWAVTWKKEEIEGKK